MYSHHFSRQRICAGLKQAYFFQKEVYPCDANGAPRVTALLTREEGPTVVTETIFDSVMKESGIRNKRAQRQGLLKGIISLFEKDPDQENTDADQLPLLAFASEILAHLPYTSLNDPLFIVYHSSCISALDGQAIVSQFAQLVGGDLCDPNPGEDDIERASKNKGKFNPAEFGLLLMHEENSFCHKMTVIRVSTFLELSQGVVITLKRHLFCEIRKLWRENKTTLVGIQLCCRALAL